jgi:hypothetical protein
MIFGIAMVRDEADIIEHTIRHMLTQVDHIIVADNRSADGTRELLKSLPVTLVDDPEIGYYQSFKMSRLAQQAADAGATWVVPFDADEFWYSPHGRIGDVLEPLTESVATAALFNQFPTAEDPDDANPFKRIGWRKTEVGGLPKVACKPRPNVVIEQGNHGANFGGAASDLLKIRHFPWRSAEQFERKARNGAEAYAATDLPEDQGQHWRDYGRILDTAGPDALADVFRSWFWSPDPHADPTIVFDPCPLRS